jgi:oligosaccharyltransferase complex subunit beta
MRMRSGLVFLFVLLLVLTPLCECAKKEKKAKKDKSASAGGDSASAASSSSSSAPAADAASSSESEGTKKATKSEGKKPLRALVLVDDVNISNSHSLFLSSLKARGAKVTVSLSTDPKLRLREYGEYIWELVVVFSPQTAKFGGLVDVKSLVEFVDSGRSLVVAGSSKVKGAVRDLAKEMGVEFDAEGTAVLDHFSYDKADDAMNGLHTLVISNEIRKLRGVLGSTVPAPVLFDGVGHHPIDPNNKLLTPFIAGSPTAYSAAATETVKTVGKSIGLVSLLQARNNARVVICGSLNFFGDALLTSAVTPVSGPAHPRSGNEYVVESLMAWVLQQRGVLRLNYFHHHKEGENSTAVYRIRDNLELEMSVDELVDGTYIPFAAKDVQLEFTMLDPHIRTTLKNDGSGKLTAKFMVPDVYGVFQFKIDYRREGKATQPSFFFFFFFFFF